MSVYSATFLHADRPDDPRFKRCVEYLESHEERFSPCEVRAFPDWIVIDRYLDPGTLQDLSARLATEVIGIYAIDEKVLSFQFAQYRGGQVVRVLEKQLEREADDAAPWARVEGEPQEWEAKVFFASPDPYLRVARSDEEREKIRRAFSEKRIAAGATIPGAAEYTTIKAMTEALGLPWQEVRTAGLPQPVRIARVGTVEMDALPPSSGPKRRRWWQRLLG